MMITLARQAPSYNHEDDNMIKNPCYYDQEGDNMINPCFDEKDDL